MTKFLLGIRSINCDQLPCAEKVSAGTLASLSLLSLFTHHI